MVLLRSAIRATAPALRSIRPTALAALPRTPLPPSVRFSSSHATAESYEQFNARYVEFFNTLEDPFELMRGLNNCFMYDLVPSQEVIESALKAARRVNDYGIAVRVYDALKDKTETQAQYEAYVRETEPLRKELGIMTADELYERPTTYRVPFPGP